MGVTGWKMVAAGQTHTVALGNNDTLYAWGQNNDGQLGDGTTSDTSSPVMVTFPTGVKSWTAVAAGASHTIAIGNDGNVYAWGFNSTGQLGDTSTTNSSLPRHDGIACRSEAHTGLRRKQLEYGTLLQRRTLCYRS